MEHLSAGGVSVVIDDRGQVIHWGAALPDDPATLAGRVRAHRSPAPPSTSPSRSPSLHPEPRAGEAAPHSKGGLTPL